MTYTEALKSGVRLINQNWQIVLIQVIVVILSSLGFFVIVGIPFAIAFIIFGIDLTKFTEIRDILEILRTPSEIITKYIGLLLIVVVSLFIYLIMITILSIYAFAGSLGIICRSVVDKELRFRVQIFFDEAKKNFSRLLGFTLVMGLIMVVMAFFLGILAGGIGALVSIARSQDSILALFLATFFSLILALIVLTVVLIILSVTLYGIAPLLFKSMGPIKSVKESVRYLIRHPYAFWFYAALFGGYLFVSLTLILIKYPLTLLPIIGTILSFPLQLISYAFETYLGLVIIASILTFYYSTEIRKEDAIESVPDEEMAQEKESS
ncbi:MAG: hypothetical protein AB1390_00220 [Nitrospirota bacterium]